jgi:hypothetical protein
MQRPSDSDGGPDRMLKELRQIKNLLMLAALKSGATSEEVDYATGMGASNIRRLFPVKRGKRQKSA